MVGKRRTWLTVDNLEAMSKIYSYYITNIKPELINYGKDRTAEEIRAILNDTCRNIEDDKIDKYNEEEMAEILARSLIDNNEQIPSQVSQQLEISNVLDLDLMFKDNSVVNKQLDVDELDDFIQELNKEVDFDPDLLVQNFISN